MTTRALTFRQVALLAAFVAATLVIFAWLYRSGGGRLPTDDAYQVQAVVPDAVALSDGAAVREAGVRVGRVGAIANHAGNAVLRLDLERSHAPVHRDASAQVRLKSLVGENYVELDPGRPAAGDVPEGGVLPLRNAEPSTQLDQILSTFDKGTRKDLARLLRGVGTGLRGRGDELNATLGGMADTVGEGVPVTTVLAAQRGQVARLVDDVGRVMRAVGDRGAALRVMARRGRIAAEAVAARDAALGRTLGELPATLRQVRRTTTRLGTFSGQATPVVGDLATGLERLGPVVADLRPAASSARTLVQRLSTFSARGVPLLKDLKTFSAAALPAVDPLDRSLAQADPALAYLAPYDREVAAFFSNLRSATNARDATGHLARVYGIYDDTSVSDATGFTRTVLDKLFSVGALHKLRTRGDNPHPAPGEIGVGKPLGTPYPRLQPLPPTARSAGGR